MFPYIRVPGHITALYIFEVINYILFFHVTLIQADVIVTSTRTNRTVKEIADFPATFGPSIPDRGIKGLVVFSNPPDGCFHIEPPPSSSGVQWFVLIRRFGCDFDQKVLNAQKAGYSAAIVYNVNSNSINPMGPDEGQGISIPSVFIGYDDGLEIRARYTYDKGYSVTITPGLPDFYNLDLQKYILPFICVLGVCFLTTIVTLIIKCVKDHRRSRRHRLSPKHLKKLPVRKFKKGDQYDTCAVCLDEYTENEKIRELPCSHVYHTKCIDPWLTGNRRTCPVCKRKVFAPGTVANDSDDDSDDEGGGASETTPLLRSGGASLPTNGSTFSHPRTSAPPNHLLLFSHQTVTESVTTVEISYPGTSHVESHVVTLSSDGSVNGSTSDYTRAADGTIPATVMEVSPSRELSTPVEIGLDIATLQQTQDNFSHRVSTRDSDRVV